MNINLRIVPAGFRTRRQSAWRSTPHHAFRQILAKDPLIIFGDQHPFRLVALVEEGEAEGEADILENRRILRPADHGSRAHHRGNVAVDETLTRQIRDLDHVVDRVVAGVRHFRQDHLRFGRGRQIVERDDDVPAVHLALVDLLGAVIEAAGVAEADRVGGREQAEIGVGPDHPVLVEKGQLAFRFQDPLDHEHHVGATGVIFVEHQSGWCLQSPGQKAFAKFGDLLAVLQDNGIASDQIDPADMGVEIDPDAGPVEAGGDLLDMGRFPGAVIALYHHPAVEGKAGENGGRGFRIEDIGGIEVGDAFVLHAEGRDLHIEIDTEYFARIDDLVRGIHDGFAAGVEIGIWYFSHVRPSKLLVRWSKSLSSGQSNDVHQNRQAPRT